LIGAGELFSPRRCVPQGRRTGASAGARGGQRPEESDAEGGDAAADEEV